MVVTSCTNAVAPPTAFLAIARRPGGNRSHLGEEQERVLEGFLVVLVLGETNQTTTKQTTTNQTA